MTVLHGRITIDALSEILYITEQQSRRVLTVLKEDGIVISENNFYWLHAMLYRHVVSLLKARNLIN